MKTPVNFDNLDHETPEEDLLALRELGRDCEAMSIQSPHSIMAVEVGTWAGRTALVLAEYFDMIYCVDHWRGNPDDRLGELASRYGPRHAFTTFCHNMGGLLMSRVIPCVGSSRDWANIWPIYRKLDLVFLDGDHRYEEVAADIHRWAQHVRPNGIICGHDYGAFPGVTRAVDEAFPDRQLAGRTVWWKRLP
jgi:hypothetical protein